jgi:hypothetical protein
MLLVHVLLLHCVSRVCSVLHGIDGRTGAVCWWVYRSIHVAADVTVSVTVLVV